MAKITKKTEPKKTTVVKKAVVKPIKKVVETKPKPTTTVNYITSTLRK